MTKSEYQAYLERGRSNLKNKPSVGQYILYNVNSEHKDHSGRPYNGYRGIAKVESYTKNFICLNKMVHEEMESERKETFSIMTDIYTGFFKYIVLECGVYKGGREQFEYEELDINNPHELILQHIIEK